MLADQSIQFETLVKIYQGHLKIMEADITAWQWNFLLGAHILCISLQRFTLFIL